MVGRYSRSVVGDADDGAVSHSLANEFDGAVGVSGGVVDEIAHHARELSAVAANPGGADPCPHRQSRVALQAGLFGGDDVVEVDVVGTDSKLVFIGASQ